MRLLSLLFFLFTTCFATLSAQNQTIDSLQKEVKAWFPSKDRTELLLDLAYEYIKIEQPEVTDSICLAIIKKYGNSNGYKQIGEAYRIMAMGVSKNKVASNVYDQVDSLLILSQKFSTLGKDSVNYVKAAMSRIFSETPDLKEPGTRDKFLHLLNYEQALRGKHVTQKAHIYHNIYRYYYHNALDSAAWYWTKYQQIIDANINEIDNVELFLNVAKHYYKESNFYKTLAYIERAKKESIVGNWFSTEMQIASFEAEVYSDASWHDKAITILQEGLDKMKNRAIHPYYRAKFNNELGDTFYAVNDFEKSVHHYELAMEIGFEFDSVWAHKISPYVLNARVAAFEKEEDIEKLIQLNESNLEQPFIFHFNAYRLAEIYAKKEQWNKAEEYLHQTWEFHTNIGNVSQMNALYNLRAKINYGKNRASLAYQDQLQSYQLQDSVSEAFAQNAITMMEYDLIQKEELIEKNKEIEILKIANSKREGELRLYSMLFLSFILLFGGIVFWQNRQRFWKQERQKFEGQLKEMETFNQGVSHNINAPLNHALYTLKKQGPRFIQKVQKYILEAQEITSSLAAFVQIDQTQIQQSKFNLNYLIQPLFEEYQTQYSTINFLIDPSISEKEISLKGDKYLLNLALRNLIENAITHGQSQQQATTIIASFSKNKGKNHLTIADNGKGIDINERSWIFDLNYSSKKSNQKNKGLGLAIVKKVMDKHLGEVTVQQSPSGGAAFTLAY